MIRKINSKKGQIFTIIALVLIALLFISVEFYSSIKERRSVRDRVETMDSYLYSLEKNLERQLYISGFRIIFLANDHITQTGTYIELNDFFNETFFNGSINGEYQDLMNGAKYYDLVNSLSNKTSKINANVSLVDPKIYVSMSDPWTVKFILSTKLTIEDSAGLVRWDRNENITAYIPIEGFEDPVYLIGTGAKISHKINKTKFVGNYVINGTNFDNLNEHINEGLYTNNTDAPNFLQRLEGNLTSDINGIESLVDLQFLSQQGI